MVLHVSTERRIDEAAAWRGLYSRTGRRAINKAHVKSDGDDCSGESGHPGTNGNAIAGTLITEVELTSHVVGASGVQCSDSTVLDMMQA